MGYVGMSGPAVASCVAWPATNSDGPTTAYLSSAGDLVYRKRPASALPGDRGFRALM